MSERFFNEEFLQRLERIALVARRATAGQTQGERRSRKRGQSVEFADFRPYVAGDDFRRIDWNAYARLDRFFIKLFVEEEDLTVHFLIDTSRSMRFGEPQKLEYALRAVGALGYMGLSGLDRITVTAVGNGKAHGNGSYFPPHRGKQQALTFFSFLQGLEGSPTADISGSRPNPGRALQAYAASAARLGPLVLFSDLMDDGWQEGLRALAGRGFEVTVVHTLSSEEAQPSLEGDFKLLDAEDGGGVEITADYELLARYRKGLADWQEGLRRFCAARQINYVAVLSTLPLDELLFTWLRLKGVLR